MKNIILFTICMFFAFKISAQIDQGIVERAKIIDTIKYCNDTLCILVDRSETALKFTKVTNINKPFRNLYYKRDKRKKKNRIRNNYKNHRISYDDFKRVLPISDSIAFCQMRRFERRAHLRKLILQESHSYQEVNRLLRLTQLTETSVSKTDIRNNIERLGDYQTTVFLLEGFNEYYYQKLRTYKTLRTQINPPSIRGLADNREIITNHIDFLLRKDYMNYALPTSKPVLIKGSSIYHDNDFFLPIVNEDRYYTGGGRFEIYTDYLRLNFLQNLVQNLLGGNYSTLTYQSIFAGVEAYTPQIRYDDILEANEGKSIDGKGKEELYRRYEMDRPFASYEYYGIAYYRLHHQGNKRARIQVRIGQVGGVRSESVQNRLHQDVTIKSLKVLGWERQIANGGRLAMNFDYERDWLLYAPKGTNHKSAFNYKGNSVKRLFIEGNVKLSYGHFLTAAEVGIGIANLGFKDRDGSNNFNLKLGHSSRFHITSNLSLRGIVHNSSLAGFGTYKKIPDDPSEPDTPKDVYFLEKESINRFVGYWNTYFGLRSKRITIFGRVIFHTQETKLPNSASIYGWGTIGLSFNNINRFKNGD